VWFDWKPASPMQQASGLMNESIRVGSEPPRVPTASPGSFGAMFTWSGG
jgi:hypothetical protein